MPEHLHLSLDSKAYSLAMIPPTWLLDQALFSILAEVQNSELALSDLSGI